MPERTVKLFPVAAEKTTKLYIIDVKPRSPAVKESEVLSCYGLREDSGRCQKNLEQMS